MGRTPGDLGAQVLLVDVRFLGPPRAEQFRRVVLVRTFLDEAFHAPVDQESLGTKNIPHRATDRLGPIIHVDAGRFPKSVRFPRDRISCPSTDKLDLPSRITATV